MSDTRQPSPQMRAPNVVIFWIQEVMYDVVLLLATLLGAACVGGLVAVFVTTLPDFVASLTASLIAGDDAAAAGSAATGAASSRILGELGAFRIVLGIALGGFVAYTVAQRIHRSLGRRIDAIRWLPPEPPPGWTPRAARRKSQA